MNSSLADIRDYLRRVGCQYIWFAPSNCAWRWCILWHNWWDYFHI